MNLSTLVTRLRQSIGNPSTGDVIDETLKQCINDSYREIGDKYRFFITRKLCTFTTVSGTSSYTLPASNVTLMRVYDLTNKASMIRMSDGEAQDYREDESDSSTYGKPQYYTHYRDWIRFIPVPDGEYTMEIYYRYVMSDLTADDDTPVLPEPWHVGILRLARFNYYEFVANDASKAASAMNAYNQWLQDKPDEVGEELRWSNRGVVVPTLANWNPKNERDFNHGE